MNALVRQGSNRDELVQRLVTVTLVALALSLLVVGVSIYL